MILSTNENNVKFNSIRFKVDVVELSLILLSNKLIEKAYTSVLKQGKILLLLAINMNF